MLRNLETLVSSGGVDCALVRLTFLGGTDDAELFKRMWNSSGVPSGEGVRCSFASPNIWARPVADEMVGQSLMLPKHNRCDLLCYVILNTLGILGTNEIATSSN